MDILYLGHSSFRIKGKKASVVIDPFDPEMVGLKYANVEADIVTISHQHEDHNFLDKIKGDPRVFSGPGEYEVKGISILGFATFHDKTKGTERGRNTVYVYEIDGLRICHLGDLGHKLPQTLLEEIGDIDILMVPVGGKYTIDSKIANEVVSSLEPLVIIPMHYHVQGIKISGLEPLENFLKESGLTVEKVTKFSIKKEDIALDSQKIIVFEKK